MTACGIGKIPANCEIAQMTSEYMLGQKEAKVIREYVNRTNEFQSKSMNNGQNLAVSNNCNGNRSHGRWNMNLSPAYSGIIFNVISGIMHLSFSRLNNHPWLCYHKRHVIGLSCILHFIISLLYVIIMCLCCYLSSRQFLQLPVIATSWSDNCAIASSVTFMLS